MFLYAGAATDDDDDDDSGDDFEDDDNDVHDNDFDYDGSERTTTMITMIKNLLLVMITVMIK